MEYSRVSIKFLVFVFFVSIFSVGCSTNNESRLAQVIGEDLFQIVTIVNTVDESTFGDTAIAWLLTHNPSVISSIERHNIFHTVDIADSQYAKNLSMKFFPTSLDKQFQVFLDDSSDNVDVYWLVSIDGKSSVVMLFEY